MSLFLSVFLSLAVYEIESAVETNKNWGGLNGENNCGENVSDVIMTAAKYGIRNDAASTDIVQCVSLSSPSFISLS